MSQIEKQYSFRLPEKTARKFDDYFEKIKEREGLSKKAWFIQLINRELEKESKR